MPILHPKLTIADMTLAQRAVIAIVPLTATAATILFEPLAAMGAEEVVVINQEKIPDSRWRVVSVDPTPCIQENLLAWPVTLHSDVPCESEVTYI